MDKQNCFSKNQGHPRRVRLLEKPTSLKRTKQARPPQYPPPYRSRDIRDFDRVRDYNDFGSDDDVTIPLNAKLQKEVVAMCTATTQKQV